MSTMTVELPQTVIDVDLHADVPCSSMHATGEPATWAGLMSDCRHVVTACDVHRERVIDGRPGIPWWHEGCPVFSQSVQWRRL